MTEPRKISNRKPIYVNAEEQNAIYGLAYKMEISEWQAIHLALVEGLKQFGVVNEAIYQKLHQRYSKPLKERIAPDHTRGESMHKL